MCMCMYVCRRVRIEKWIDEAITNFFFFHLHLTVTISMLSLDLEATHNQMLHIFPIPSCYPCLVLVFPCFTFFFFSFSFAFWIRFTIDLFPCCFRILFFVLFAIMCCTLFCFTPFNLSGTKSLRHFVPSDNKTNEEIRRKKKVAMLVLSKYRKDTMKNRQEKKKQAGPTFR